MVGGQAFFFAVQSDVFLFLVNLPDDEAKRHGVFTPFAITHLDAGCQSRGTGNISE